ncbi:hypothetical protein [Corynebacterium sputi]|uniref:hypothetical protein n=1 Tax=Corynebacterium sputi TaxID=489915 RepID=UPI000422A211|nr:hypothetical protein [Corynebacterium sputi]
MGPENSSPPHPPAHAAPFAAFVIGAIAFVSAMLVAALIAIGWPAFAQATNVEEQVEKQVGSTAIGAIDVTVIDMAKRLSDEDVANL